MGEDEVEGKKIDKKLGGRAIEKNFKMRNRSERDRRIVVQVFVEIIRRKMSYEKSLRRT